MPFSRTAYWADHNQRFARPPASPDDFHVTVPRGVRLDAVFRMEETRTVSNDWVVRYDNRYFQLERQSHRPPARSTVQVYEAADGQIDIRYRDRVMRWHELVPEESARETCSPGPRPSARRATVRAMRNRISSLSTSPSMLTGKARSPSAAGRRRPRPPAARTVERLGGLGLPRPSRMAAVEARAAGTCPQVGSP